MIVPASSALLVVKLNLSYYELARLAARIVARHPLVKRRRIAVALIVVVLAVPLGGSFKLTAPLGVEHERVELRQLRTLVALA